MKIKHPLTGFILFVAILTLTAFFYSRTQKTVVWKLNNAAKIGGQRTRIIGHPTVMKDKQGSFLAFNGRDDAIVIPTVPISGRNLFTIEVCFKPDEDGPVDPRFIHFQDTQENRGTFEIRINKNRQWYLDTFLKQGKPVRPDRGLSLIDSTLTHDTGKWYWAALVYDGRHMTSYVNGVKEAEGDIYFPGMAGGELSLGARLNKVNWFKGGIREVRFHSSALNAGALQR